MQRIIPIRPLLLEAGHQQPIALNHHLRIARLHRKLEVVIVVLPGDMGKLQRALNHSQGGIAEPVHDPVTQGPVVGPDPHRTAQLLAEFHQRGELFLYPAQLGSVLFVGIFLDGELLRVGIVAWIDSHRFNPKGRLHGCLRLEVNVRNDGDGAAASSQGSCDVLEVRSILDRGCGDPDDLAAHSDQIESLFDTFRCVHRVAGDHRLHDDGMPAAHDHPAMGRISDNHFTGIPAPKDIWRFAATHVQFLFESLGANFTAAGFSLDRFHGSSCTS